MGRDKFLDDADLEDLQRLFGPGITPPPPPPNRRDQRFQMTLEEVSREMSCSRTLVQMIEKSALRKCQAWCAANGLRLEDVLGA